MTAPATPVARPTGRVNASVKPPIRLKPSRVWTIARTELKQLIEARDFWMPMMILGGIFFLVIPTILLFAITSIGNIHAVHQISQAVQLLPAKARAAVRGKSEQGQTAYALAVFLLAPVAVVVPLTISTAVGASTIVGERERGTGEFLAHSPASVHEIYLGKLIASVVPGYVTTIVGFGLYSLIVNLIVGPQVGGWFFPTANWWILVLWVVPPFLALVVGIILRISSRVTSAAAAQQASALVTLPLVILAYGLSTGSLSRAKVFGGLLGLAAWIGASIVLWTGARALRRERLLGLGA